MVFASVNALECPCKHPPAIQTALTWITEHDVAHMGTGVYEIQGRDLYVNVQDITTQPVENCYPERHNDYLDIQYVVSGAERMGYVPCTGKETVLKDFSDRDIIFYKDLENETFVDVTPGCYCIFFSNDIHRPGCAAGEPSSVRKIVVKIRQSLLD